MELQRYTEDAKPVPLWDFSNGTIRPDNAMAWAIQADIERLSHAA